VLPPRVTMLIAPKAVMPVERSKFVLESWNSCTTSLRKVLSRAAFDRNFRDVAAIQ